MDNQIRSNRRASSGLVSASSSDCRAGEFNGGESGTFSLLVLFANIFKIKTSSAKARVQQIGAGLRFCQSHTLFKTPRKTFAEGTGSFNYWK